MMLKSTMSCKAVRATTSIKPANMRPRAVVVRAKGPEGFVEEDSAGQTNMFPSVVKPFEAGSSADTNDGSVAVVGGGGAALAVAVVAAGLFLASQGTPVPTAEGDYESLSSYSTKFAGELGLKSVAAVPVSAPAVVAA